MNHVTLDHCINYLPTWYEIKKELTSYFIHRAKLYNSMWNNRRDNNGLQKNEIQFMNMLIQQL